MVKQRAPRFVFGRRIRGGRAANTKGGTKDKKLAAERDATAEAAATACEEPLHIEEDVPAGGEEIEESSVLK